MGRKKTKTIPGLRFRGGVWHIEKTVSGTRLFESTGTDDLKEAQRRLIFLTRSNPPGGSLRHSSPPHF